MIIEFSHPENLDSYQETRERKSASPRNRKKLFGTTIDFMNQQNLNS